MKKRYLLLVVCVFPFALYGQVATDVTELYLANPGFDSNFNYGTTTSGNVKGDVINVVSGWNKDTNATYTVAGTFAYGSGATFNGSSAIPVSGYKGSAGGALALSTGWGSSLNYSQTVTLPGGRYALVSAYYNAGSVKAGFSMVGWIPDGGGQAAVSTVNAFPLNTWVVDTIPFVVPEKTGGKIQAGFTSVSGVGSGSSAKVLIDFVKIIYYGVDKTELNTLIAQADVLYGVGAGLEADALLAATNYAKGVAGDGEAGMSGILDATSRLKNAILTYQLTNASGADPLDMTHYLVNPGFESGFGGWINYGMTTQTNTYLPGKTGGTYVEAWVSRGSRVPDVSMQQLLTGIPNGKYRLIVKTGNIQQSATGSSVNNTSKPQTGAFLFAGHKALPVDTIKDQSLDFVVIDNQVTIGLKTENATGNWVPCDNFRLKFIGLHGLKDYADYLNDYITEAEKLLTSKMQNTAWHGLEATLAQARETIAAKPLVEDDLSAARTAIAAAVNVAQTSMEAYNKLQTAINYANQVLEWYADEAAKKEKLQPVVATANEAANNLNLTLEELVKAETALTTVTKTVDKQVYLPYSIYNGAAGGYISQSTADYEKPESRFSTARMKQTQNFVFLWEAGFGDDPETAAAGYKVPMKEIMEKLEDMYAFYRDKLKFVKKGSSKTDKYKMVVFLFYNKDFGTVYGGGVDNTTGALFLYPSRIQYGPYGALAHELGHAFQGMVAADGHPGFGGTAWEMTSQYMLWQYYDTWPTFEGYHVTSFMGQSHLAFTHADNQYHSPFVLEYWADLHGQDVVGDLWNKATSGEDFVGTYKRVYSLTQAAFNDEMFDAARKFITWDLKRGNTISQHANKHTYKLNDIGAGWHQVATTHTPQNYGYNGVRLNVPAANTTITASFKGLTEASGYNIINKTRAGWRYGFVAYKKDGSKEYGEAHSDVNGYISYTVPANTSYLWFVVMGAPTLHWKHEGTPAQWPYQVRFGNTNLYGLANNPVGLSTLAEDEIQAFVRGDQLSISGVQLGAMLRVSTAEGEILINEEVKESSFSTTLSPGVYIINVTFGGESYNQKIVIGSF